jgi:ADP-heptose:LPS heptosyltransferase
LKEANFKILIIRFSSIGDIVLTTPVVRCLKQQLPGAKIHYLTKKVFHGVLKNNPYIDKFHLLEDSLSAILSELKAEKFDYVIDLHKNVRTLFVKSRLGVKSSSYDKLNIEKWLLVNFKINMLPPIHIVDRYLKTVKFLGVQNDGKGLDYFFEKEYTLDTLLPPSHQHYTGIVIGAQHFTKRLPVHKLIEVCKLLNQPVVLMGGKDDAARAQEIISGAGEHVFNACGKFTLDESAFLVKMAKQIITHDTGLMHIAAAFNKPLVSVWGNTVPEFGMFPYKVKESKILGVEGLRCRPCSKIGYQKCPLGHFKCMNDQNANEIVNFNFNA